MSDLTIRTADSDADVHAAGELIAWSFDDLGANRWLVPDEVNRRPILGAFFALLARHAANGAGEILLLEDGADLRGCVVWFDYSGEPAEFTDYDKLLEEAVGPYLPRFQRLDALLEEHHPTEPHAHLAFLAVQPGFQGRGLGAKMLQHTHSRFAELPAYLEATNPDNQRLYRAHGYADMAPATFLLPDGTPFYRMWRNVTA